MKKTRLLLGLLLCVLLLLAAACSLADNSVSYSFSEPLPASSEPVSLSYEITLEAEAKLTFSLTNTLTTGSYSSSRVEIKEIRSKTTGTPKSLSLSATSGTTRTGTVTLEPDTYIIPVSQWKAGFELVITGSYIPTTAVTQLNLIAGETFTVPFSRADGLTRTWTSSSTSVATVSSDVVTAVDAGSAIIRCKFSDGTEISITVTVISFSARDREFTLTVGSDKFITVNRLPSGAAVTWSSSNGQVAAVTPGSSGSSGCTIKAVSPGQATVTAQVDGFSPLTAVVTVPEITISPAECTLSVGSTQGVTVANVGSSASQVWSSDNESVAVLTDPSYSSSGFSKVIKAVGPGSTVVRLVVNDTFTLTVNVTVSPAGLTPAASEIRVGENVELTLTGTSLSDSGLDWASSDEAVARVGSYNYNNKRTIYAESPGTVTIAVSHKGVLLATATVTVSEVWLSPSPLKVGAKESKQLKIEGMYEYAHPAVEWTSSNTKIAVVDDEGNVTGKSAGTAEISVRLNGGKSYSAEVTVVPSISAKKADVAIGETLKLKINGAKKKDKVKWKSSNPKIASVDKKGVVTAGNKTGKVTITATCGKTKMKCKVTVRPKVTVEVTRITDTAIWNEVYVAFQNYSNKKVVYVKLNILQYDNAGHKLRSPYDWYYLNETIKPRSRLTGHYYWVNGDTKKAKVFITEVTFSDGSKWRP